MLLSEMARVVPSRRATDLAGSHFSWVHGTLLLARVQRNVSVIHRVTRQLSNLVDDAVRR